MFSWRQAPARPRRHAKSAGSEGRRLLCRGGEASFAKATQKAALRAEMEAGRARGWYLNAEESMDGLTALSAPFRWHQSVYIVTIAAPSSRLEGRLEQTARKLQAVCARLEMKAAR